MDARTNALTNEPRGPRPLILVLGLAGLLALLLALVGRSPLLWPLGLVMFGACVRLSAAPSREAEDREDPPATVTVPMARPPALGPLPEIEVGVPARDPVRALLEELLASLGGDAVSAHLWLRDECSQSLRPLAAVGPLRPELVPLPLDDDPVGRAVSRRSPAVAATATVRLGEQPSTLWRVAAPLTPADTALAVVLDMLSAEVPPMSPLTDAVRRLDTALSSAALLWLAEEEAAEARSLSEALAGFDGVDDRRELLERALIAAMSLASGTAGSLMLADPDRCCLRVVVSRGARRVLDGTEIPEGEGIAGWVAATRSALLVEDLPHRPEPARPSSGRSSVSVPLIDGDAVLGVLNVGCAHYPGMPMARRVDALAVLARRVAFDLRRLPA